MGHRGPDGHGRISEALPQGGRVCLGHSRLAIIDLSSAAAQPMESDRSTLTYNGEIYNFQHLAAELGLPASDTRGDSAVLQLALERWGVDALPRLSGMFAFGHLLREDGRLLLARDRAGIKPLYLWSDGQGLTLFASELRALLASGLVPRTLDAQGLAQYLHFGHSVGRRTLLQGVQVLLPGSMVTLDSSGMREERWAARVREASGPPTTLPDFADALEASVEEQLISDRPLGVFLSGGLDSTVVTGLAAAQAASIRTVSLVFPEIDKVDNRLSREVAEFYGTDHQEVPVVRADLEAALDDCLSAYDSPSYDGVNSYFVSRAARQAGLTVCLSGLGGDEYFGGYYTSNLTRMLLGVAAPIRATGAVLARPILSALSHQPRSGRIELAARLASIRRWDAATVYAALVRIFRSAEVRTLAPELARTEGSSSQLFDFLSGPVPLSLEAIAECDWHLFMGDQLLRDGDQMAMATSLEVRFPFLGPEVEAAGLALPNAVRFDRIPTKHSLVEAFRSRLPAAVTDRPKEGFSLPMKLWLGTHAARLLRELGTSRAGRTIGLNQDVLVRRYAKEGTHDLGAAWSKVWSLVVLLSWIDRHDLSL